MRILNLCLVLVLMCSCSPKGGKSGSENDERASKRRNKVSMIIKDHYGSKYGFEVRGPLNVAQLEKEFGKSHEETAAMNRLKNPYREGDEVYFFTSDVQSWSDRAGVEGYVLIRKDRIVDGIVTGMN